MNQFSLKAKLFFGPQAVEHLSSLACTNVLVVTDGFLQESGMVSKMTQYLPSGAHVSVYSNVRPDPSQELVDAGVEMIFGVKPDVVIAFGGGSCIDATKAILYFAGQKGLAHPYFLAIPTTAGTGSEVTNFAVITRGDTKVALIDDALAPDGALLDASFTRSVPPKITADTGMDVLTHALEAYVSNQATTFTDALAVKALRVVFEDLPVVFHDGDAMRARGRMAEASCVAGIAFTNAGLGINHSLAHALGGRFHVAHGRLNAILLPYVMRFHMADSKYREPYERCARELGMADAEDLLRHVIDLRAELGVEDRLADLGSIDASAFEEHVGDMAEAALGDRCTPTNPRPVSRQDLVNLYRDAYNG
ncbi:1-propanol dehydrogenase PduQ [Parafannyhessea umbonata]|uniref:Alcohol dehydrogenase, class IV n=1 Tax=Parafannyhessea umbonata TaxID=604330 RepID=A0A1H1KTT4_9ACTN|nr:1-propanol dehydrogenase PduQ [Parafannyhessea umbonata]SDR65089.1 Alcohol dehydrogenase, class IV [Parafannyhessea umbonata]